MMLAVEDYRAMTRVLLDVADEICGGRLVAIHEGGYSAEYVPFCGHAIVEELAGSAIRAGDPFANPRVSPTTGLQPHQALAIETAAAGLAPVP